MAVSLRVPRVRDLGKWRTQTSSSSLHLHFGPGRLGLGFVVPMVQQSWRGAGLLQTCLITREPATAERAALYKRLRDGGGYTAHIGRHADSIRLDSVVSFGDAALNLLLRSPRLNVLTTSVGSGSSLRLVGQALGRALLREAHSHDSRAALIVAACENPPLGTSILEAAAAAAVDDLGGNAEDVLAHVTFVPAVADRICPTFPHAVGRRVEVESEAHGELLLLENSGMPRPYLLGPPTQWVGREAFKFAALRKRWLLNNAQLAVALRAWRRGEEHPARLLDHPEYMKYARSFLSTCSRALCESTTGCGVRAPLASESVVRSYASQVIERVAAAREDRTSRILRRIRGGSSLDWAGNDCDAVAETILGPLTSLVDSGSGQDLAASQRDAVGVFLSDLLFVVGGENLSHSARDGWLDTPQDWTNRTAMSISTDHELKGCLQGLSGLPPQHAQGRALRTQTVGRIVRTAQDLGAMRLADGLDRGAGALSVRRRSSWNVVIA